MQMIRDGVDTGQPEIVEARRAFLSRAKTWPSWAIEWEWSIATGRVTVVP